MSFGARAVIRLDALSHNLKRIREAAPGARVMAVVKANAYGHGLVPVARKLATADGFAVARLPEALELRAAGISQPITVLSGVFSRDELERAAEHRVDIVVHDAVQLAWLEAPLERPVTAWLEIDTGMNRLGFPAADARDLIERLHSSPAIGELRLMTHFAEADDLDGPVTPAQLERFRDAAERFAGDIGIANSPALLGWPDIASGPLRTESGGADYWVRAGIALFGISPYAGRTAAELGLQPVMQFEARLIAVKPLAKGGRVGYQGRYVSPRDSTLGVIAAGYGDGYTRHFRDGTPVLVNGRRVPLIGHVSMDLATVDLGPDAEDRVGDIAVLWGDGLPVEEVAPWADAIPYELVCGVMNREASEVVE